MDKLQFLIVIFAVLLPNLCKVLFYPKTIEHLQRYCNLTVFKMVAAAILDFQKLEILRIKN